MLIKPLNSPIVKSLSQNDVFSGAIPSKAEVDESFDLSKYIRLLVRHKWGIIIFILLGALYGIIKGATEIALYQASVSLVIEREKPNLTGVQGSVIYAIPSNRYYETQFAIIKSRALLGRVVDKLKNHTGLSENNEEKNSRLDGLLSRLIPGLKSKSSSLDITKDNKERDSNTHVQMISGLTASQINVNLTIKSDSKSQIVKLSYVSPNPELAAAIANGVAETYIEYGLESKTIRVARATSWLAEKIDEIRVRVVDSEARLQLYQTKEGLIDLSQQKTITSGKLATLNSQVSETQREISELSKRYGPKHPRMLELYSKLASARRRLSTVSKGVSKEKGKEFGLEKLEREVSTNRELYEIYLTRLKETDLSTDIKLSNARVLDWAQVPKLPFKPDRLQLLSLWSSIGLFLGFLFSFVRELLDNTFKTTDSVEEKLQLPVLGIIPLVGNQTNNTKDKKKQSIVKDNLDDEDVIPERFYISEKRSSFSEIINHIRTGVMYSNIDNPPKTILVSSSVQSEGKTTLASNLALSFAQLGNTLLVDADLRKPRITKVTGDKTRGGLVEYVAGEKPLKEYVVQDKECSQLYILGGGEIPPNPLELLSSMKLKKTLEELKNKFDHIIIDTAPVLPVSDAIVLGHIVDKVIMVIQWDKTSVGLSKEALKRFTSSNIMPIGVVLSKVSSDKSTAYYGDTYNYYYSEYVREEA